MKKSFFLLALIVLLIPAYSFANTDIPDELLSLVSIKPAQTNQNVVAEMLGKPDKMESNRKQSVWYYRNDKNNITIYLNNRTATVEKCYFSAIAGLDKKAWDTNKANLLKSGETSLEQAIKLLGTPKDMLLKSSNQELHYSFQNNVLNLFFRNGTLVNFTLY